MFLQQDNKLVFRYDSEELWIEPWGEDALRVRATRTRPMQLEDWALLPLGDHQAGTAQISVTEKEATITNGNIKATVTRLGRISIHNSRGELLLKEFQRNRIDVLDEDCSALEIEAREFKPILGGDYYLTMRLESVDRNEKLFGMGQYQQPFLDLKGLDLELAQRNSQASVPFLVSSLGYGLLWNNPSIGRAVLGKNVMSFEARSTNVLDYWIVAKDKPAQTLQAYGQATGTPPKIPEWGLGFWQCKLRYQTQEELLGVARGYRERGLPLDLIVVDFFHWPKQGEWKFDPTYWPDPDAMIRELNDLNIKLMVSIWPTVDKLSENYEEMVEKGLLIRTERGIRIAMDFQGNTVHFDATNPEAREYIWQKANQNYYKKGVSAFWLDEAEPEYTAYDFDNYRYYRGPNLAIGNIYPAEYARAFYEGMVAEGQKDMVNLLRCAWAGSQRFGALVWSGDIASSWSSLRNQITAGLNMGLAGIPWWTTDIGGFHGGDPNDEAFRELFVRWFQWATFCPVMRLHGDREPRQPQHGTTGGATCRSGAPNEVWSYGETVYEICKKYLKIRDDLREYTRSLMLQAHEHNTPVMRTCFFEFPEDKKCWELEDQYMYGGKYLVAPVLYKGQTGRSVYLPEGSWRSFEGNDVTQGPQTIEVSCPLQRIPVFVRQSQ